MSITVYLTNPLLKCYMQTDYVHVYTHIIKNKSAIIRKYHFERLGANAAVD